MMRRLARVGLAAAACLVLLPAPPASARDKLPWADANPLAPIEGTAHRTPARKAPDSETPNAKAAAAAPDVPVPKARPEGEPSGAAAAGAEPAVPALAPRPKDAAVPEPRPAEVPAAAGKPPADAAGDPTDPKAAAERPVSEIPVPDERPKAPNESPAPAESPVAPAPPVDEPPNSPDKLRARGSEITPAASVLAAAAVQDAMACEAELTRRGVEFTVGPSISEGECGVLRPVKLMKLSSGVAVSPDTQLLCRSALALDEWMADSVVPAAKAEFAGDALAEFRHASTYVCRPRASESGISEHARGSAIDIGGFVFKSGREIGIAAKEAGTPKEAFLTRVRTGACGPFKTVLGPGTDPDHATHFHLDIAARKNGATYCK